MCAAVNYWYDMQYDLKYAYYQFLVGLSSSMNHDHIDQPSTNDNIERGLGPGIQGN